MIRRVSCHTATRGRGDALIVEVQEMKIESENNHEEFDPVKTGRLGGMATNRRHGIQHYRDIGRLGGLRTRELHGAMYSVWGKLGGRPKRIRWPGESS